MVVSNRKRAEIISDLKTRGFSPIIKKAEPKVAGGKGNSLFVTESM
jgi:hypothetical protein